jgi:hypothetical protein
VLRVNTPAAKMRALGKAVMLISMSIAVSWKRATARIVRNRSCQKLGHCVLRERRDRLRRRIVRNG